MVMIGTMPGDLQAAKGMKRHYFRDAPFVLVLPDNAVGGEGGIRTHGRFNPTTVFETATLSRSATSPADAAYKGFLLSLQRPHASGQSLERFRDSGAG